MEQDIYPYLKKKESEGLEEIHETIAEKRIFCPLCEQEVYECSDCEGTICPGDTIFCEPEATPWVKHHCHYCMQKKEPKGED